MKKVRFMRVVAILVVITSLYRHHPCRADSQEDFFENRIRPVLSEHCIACHSNQAGKSNGGLKLDSRSGVFEGGESGPGVNFNDVRASLMVRAVRRQDTEVSAMPPDSRHLTEQQVLDLEKWIGDGAFYPDPIPA